MNIGPLLRRYIFRIDNFKADLFL